ncbi:tryptophan synthase beta subunit-like PLP-dependent enzyme [Alternaria rosae]|uniref:tryptophan synthase beta subunit-like PLP-dependent enzyme n=1 Tax=Alternaria rosae TaxID=1187941 RepID=UPI001E8CC690|nr:tryptophan synthase beta subunit-like PLP-dependent enzyme [Alternaria rosae]KAH6881709.1 tryptophan synthase beta subunit-like PLP-dependent enzyme [Alternaria rosae]
MVSRNYLNAYSGPDALQNYFDPDRTPMIPLVEIPPSLNPYYNDGVRIHAKMMSMHPSNNVKIMPALNMLTKEVHPEKSKTVVEYSSGSTVISLALVSRINHGIQDVRAFLSNKTSAPKLRLMQFFGLDITLFGGPSQPEPHDERGGIHRARIMAEKDEAILNVNQYENDANWQSHVKWTGPQIHQQLPNIRLMCAGMGTSGTMTGLGQYFKSAKPSVVRLGVCTAAGDRVPGPRSLALLSPVEFPWRDSVDAIEEVGSNDAFSLSLALCRAGLICGPSSGFNLQGLFNYLKKRKNDGTLSDLADANGIIDCAFVACDGPYQYIDEYFDKLGSSAFRPIHNENLTAVDLYRYDEAWELTPTRALSQFADSVDRDNGAVLLDLRKPEDFVTSHIPGSYNLPLQSLNASTPSPFSDAAVLEKQWKELESTFTNERISAHDLAGKDVYIVCYGGDTARVATSVLRAKAISARSVKGGITALREELPHLQMTERGRGLVQQDWLKSPDIAVTELRADSLSPQIRGDDGIAVQVR